MVIVQFQIRGETHNPLSTVAWLHTLSNQDPTTVLRRCPLRFALAGYRSRHHTFPSKARGNHVIDLTLDLESMASENLSGHAMLHVMPE